MKTKQIISIGIFVATLTIKLIVDLSLWKSGGENNHVIGPILVVVVLGVCSWLSGWRSIPMWLFCFWALFDSLWGLFSGNGLLYIGTTAKLDILQQKHKWLQVAKYLLAAGSIVFYFLTYKKSRV